jgi:hypothetical protein
MLQIVVRLYWTPAISKTVRSNLTYYAYQPLQGAIMRWNSAIQMLAAFLVFAIVPEVSWGNNNLGTSEGGGSIGEDEYQYVTDDSFPDEDISLEANEQNRLIFEWGKVSMGYIDYDADVITWKDDCSLRPDRQLAIRGRLMIESADGKNRQPVNWI